MNRSEITSQVTSYIEQSMANYERENSKVDFKKQWYSLVEEKGINEFLKDTCAMVNTFGPDGFIIIGYDDSTKILGGSTFKDCGLNDTAKLIDLVNKRVDRLFQFDIIEETILGKNVSIIHLPPSFDKPHVIKQYKTFDKFNAVKIEENKVFVRRGSRTFTAGKNDFELMYWNRKNVVPDYLLYSAIFQTSFRFSAIELIKRSVFERMDRPVNENEVTHINFKLDIENGGNRTVGINGFKLQLHFSENIDANMVYDITYKFSTLIILEPKNITSVYIQHQTSVGLDYKIEKYKTDFFNANANLIIADKLVYSLLFGKKVPSDVELFT